jgi:tetratricopeptide (TPR) repeat protein
MSDGNRPLMLGLAAVLAAIAAVWIPALFGGFVYDDHLLILANPGVSSWSHLGDALGSGMWGFLDADEAAHLGYWRPLASLLLLAVNVSTNTSALAFHCTSLALHLAACALVFALARDLRLPLVPALLVTLLFGVHPVHVESVAWISAINDPLYAIFALQALRSWVRWRDAGSAGTPWSAGVWFLMALLSKELALALIPVLAALDLARGHWRIQPSRAWRPLLGALLIWYLARVLVFESPEAGLLRQTSDYGVGTLRLAMLRVELLGGYTKLALFPLELRAFHPFQPGLGAADPQFLAALLLALAAVGAGCWAWMREQRTLAFALFFLPLSTLPALTRVESLGVSPLQERYLYLGVLGPLLAAGWLARARWVQVLLLLVAGLFAVRSIERIPAWSSERAFFERAILESPKSPNARWGMGRVHLEEYRRNSSPDELRAALDQFLIGLDLLLAAQRGDGTIFASRNDHIQTNLGFAWCLLYEAEATGQLGDSGPRVAFEEIAKRYPTNDQAHTGLGASALIVGDIPAAEAAFQRAIELNPRNAEAWHNLGIARLSRGDLTASQAAFREALRLRPLHLEDLVWSARIALQLGQREEFNALLASMKQRHPRSSAAWVLEATERAQAQQYEAALALVDRALDIDPEDGSALALKGKLHAARKELAQAVFAWQRAAERSPGDFEVHYNLGAALLERGQGGEALPYLLRAYGLRPRNAAGEALRRALLSFPVQSAQTWCELASIDLARGDEPSAGQWVEKALALDPEDGRALTLAGTLYLAKGEARSAEDSLRRARQRLPDDLECRLTLARLLHAQQRGDEARAMLQEVLAITARLGERRLESMLAKRTAGELLEEWSR